jgi:LacI family transcriptional regulator
MARQPQEVSISRIAKEGGVSVATVSRVLNRRVGVSEATRARIDGLLRKHEFTTSYPQSRASKLAVLVPFGDFTPYICKALNGVFALAREEGIEVSLIIPNGHRHTTALEQIRDKQCAGVVVLLAEFFKRDHEAIASTELPVVFLDEQINLDGTGFIDNDSYSGSGAATRHLLDLGHRKIGYLRYFSSSLNQLERFQGYEDAMKAAGIPMEEKWIANAPPSGDKNIRGLEGLRAMNKLLEQAPDITAVLAVDDDIALGAMTAIHKSGRKIADDISIVGFDNYPETAIWYPALTTVDHPIEQAAYQAGKAVSHAWSNPGKWRLPHEILPTRLVIRESTGPAAGEKPNLAHCIEKMDGSTAPVMGVPAIF